ncbi:hypothetical protein CXU14_04215 [Akkermansia muciniphila]|nr:hypothetical protein CXU14_04215 [Akkermansia muciniphila]
MENTLFLQRPITFGRNTVFFTKYQNACFNVMSDMYRFFLPVIDDVAILQVLRAKEFILSLNFRKTF